MPRSVVRRTSRSHAGDTARAPSGNGVSGNTQSGTIRISRGTWITSTTIPSSTDGLPVRMRGPIRVSIVGYGRDITGPTGHVAAMGDGRRHHASRQLRNQSESDCGSSRISGEATVGWASPTNPPIVDGYRPRAKWWADRRVGTAHQANRPPQSWWAVPTLQDQAGELPFAALEDVARLDLNRDLGVADRLAV